MTSSSRTEPPGCTIARTPASSRICGAVGEREERVGCGDAPARPVARALHRELARVDPVDLAHADADGGAALREQDRVRLDRAAGPPGELEVGEGVGVGRLARRRAATAARARSARRCVCSSRPPEIWRSSVCRRARSPSGSCEQAQVLLRLQHLERAGLEAGRDDDLGEDRARSTRPPRA